jgi:hypothetical protein
MKVRIQTVVAVTALAVAVLGATPVGHAAADMILPKASVGTAQLKAAAVTGSKVKNGSLTAADFKAGQIPAGPQGPKGDAGAAGAQGSPGSPGISGFQVVNAGSVAIAAGQSVTRIAPCPVGKKAISGGTSSNSQPLAFMWLGVAGDGYLVKAKNIGALADTLDVWAICATVTS